MAQLLLLASIACILLLVFTAIVKSQNKKKREALSKSLSTIETIVLDIIYETFKKVKFDGINRFELYDFLLKQSLNKNEEPESPSVIFAILEDLQKHKFIKQAGYSIFMTEFGKTFYEEFIIPRK
jgi:hypothetical protein